MALPGKAGTQVAGAGAGAEMELVVETGPGTEKLRTQQRLELEKSFPTTESWALFGFESTLIKKIWQ
jgi:hypothetical protein